MLDKAEAYGIRDFNDAKRLEKLEVKIIVARLLGIAQRLRAVNLLWSRD